MLYNVFVHAFIAQSVERRLGKAEVTGSIPVVGSKKIYSNSSVIARVFLSEQMLKIITYFTIAVIKDYIMAKQLTIS